MNDPRTSFANTLIYCFISDISQVNKVTTNMPDNALNVRVLFLAPIEGK